MAPQPSTAAEPHSPPAPGRNYRQRLGLAFALLAIALVYFYRIDSPPLWGDEADTGVEARQILKHGYPVAYDGRNVSLFDNGSQLNEDLVCNKIPWNQYYLGALSLLIFGNDTFGLRVLFAFIGLLTFFPIYDILKSRLKCPVITTALILMAPQIVLFQRNARYYPLLILLYAVLVWHLSRDFKSSRTHFFLASVIMVLLFHTHQFAALCASLSLLAFCVIYRREVLSSYCGACATGFASWFVWSRLLGPSLAETKLSIDTIPIDFGLWFKNFYTGIWVGMVDTDVVGCLPLLLWVALLAILFVRNRDAFRNLFRERLYAFVFLSLVIHIVATAALFGYDDQEKYSLLRYEPHLLVFDLVVTFMLLDAVIAQKSLYVVVALVAISCNFLSFSYWAKPLSRSVPASWLFPVYADIFNPQKNVWDQVIGLLESESNYTSDRNVVMITFPPWDEDIAIFYLGDRYLIHPFVGSIRKSDDFSKTLLALHQNIDQQAYDRMFAPPVWMVDISEHLKATPAGYNLAAVIPSYQSRPDEGTRPELIRHKFAQSTAVSEVRIFRLQE